MSQRVDANGKPSIGWQLFLYQANSSTPVTPYQDTALTVTLPWPIVADSSGMMPPFWLADGSYRARGTNADGSVIFFDQPSILALGASAGSAPSGGVDPNAIFSTGDQKFREITGSLAGWIRDNGRTIGSATSGATERANADCQALFEFYWNNFSDTLCPVLTGRGGSAASDWAANKQITTLDKRGMGLIGLDDMGNSAASRMASVPFINGNATTAGSVCGENTHTLASSELPAHVHPITDKSHTHLISDIAKSGGAQGPTGGTIGLSTENTQAAFTGITTTDNNTGGGSAHNVVSRSITGTWYRKL